MNTRKFTYITSIVLGIFLFALGTVFLFYINTLEPNDGNTPFNGMLNGLNSPGNKDPMNFLLLVGDQSSGNTDVMLVANYNPKNSKISIVTIPRDTKVKIKNSNVPKINSAYAGGGRNHKGATYASETVSNLTGISINYYVHLDISCIKGITDMLGGVYFDVPADLRYNDPEQDLYIDLKKGNQLLDGEKVEQLLRFRKPQKSLYSSSELKELYQYYDGSDIKRTEMQVKFIKAFINQKLNIQTFPKFNSVINYAFQNIITNMTLTDALKLTTGLINIKSDNFNSFRLDGEDKLISGGWYYVYNGNFINIDTNESAPSEKIVPEYFYSPNGISTPSELFVPDNDSEKSEDTPSKNTKKPAVTTRKNPSNSKTDSKGTGKDKP
ncbi:LytR family transcriptional attenuator [Ruminiclostridium sufflavum DSM 19573]|uniref:LytR family transcriptional attenuator n=1 Tax=Ruminiclostridium sufflavum DSM 19573 TaxID=1121337 RepID=A0A318XII7_9FIRM|nr:LCP family protein [Ruminiclostridium sufflavum]PYG87040.1 LytR family transcriptional attenuator [Ruminiclostridium sufflavum DSM 19573]